MEAKIGNTPLDLYSKEAPNGNRIWIKKECENPYGSHYDRVYSALFKHHEKQGKIKPGDRLLETTSGAAGVSFAGIGKELGYECIVALPGGGEKARERAILEQLSSEDHLILTDSDKYISGFTEFLKDYLPKNKDVHFLNHSMGKFNKKLGVYKNNEVTLKALEPIAKEVIKKQKIDWFFPAIGNGSSVLGPGRVFQRKNNFWYESARCIMDDAYLDIEFNRKLMEELDHLIIRIVGFEPFQSAVAYDQKYPGAYKAQFGIEPGTLSRHRLPGTSFQGIPFPHIKNSVDERILTGVVPVSDEKTDREYHKLTGRNDTKQFPHWDREKYQDVGRTTMAGIAVAKWATNSVEDRDFLVIAYDKADRYDSKN